jgi:hypothetical protein
MAQRLVAGLFLVAVAVTSLAVGLLPVRAAGDVTIALCDQNGDGVDNTRLRGIVFTVDRPFESVQVRLALPADGHYEFRAEIRRSSGFVAPLAGSRHTALDVTAGHWFVQFDFEPQAVVGSETFSFRLTDHVTPGDQGTFFEGAANADNCPDFYDTDQNDIANPTVRGNEMFARVLSSSEYPDVWGDTRCDGVVGADDALTELRQLSGIAQPAAIICGETGSLVLVNAAPATFGDWDCDGTADSEDAIAILAAIAHAAAPPEGGCFPIGAAVAIDIG